MGIPLGYLKHGPKKEKEGKRGNEKEKCEERGRD